AEVRLPDVRVEREHALERGTCFSDTLQVHRQRRAPGVLELGFEVGTLEPEPETMRLGARVEVRARARENLLELTRGLRAESRRDIDAGEVDPRRRPAARRGAFEVRTGGGLVGLLKRDDPKKLLRA